MNGILCIIGLFGVAVAFPWYADMIPNGFNVVHPCTNDTVWMGVGHTSFLGAGARNLFGQDFKSYGFTWSKELCEKDSDGDGVSNGEELGDKDCTWTMNGPPPSFEGELSHPGIPDRPSVFDPTCIAALLADNDLYGQVITACRIE